MAFNVTTTARVLSQQTNIEQQIILEIDGIDLVFGAVDILKIWRIGDAVLIGDPGLVIGGSLADPKGRAFISPKGTTNNLTQQLEIDKPSSSSIQKFNVQLVDKNNELTKVFTPGEEVADLMNRECNVYISFVGSNHPEDSIRIMNGVIENTDAGSGYWKLGIASPEGLKRQELFTAFASKLDGAIDASTTTIVADTTNGNILPGDTVRSFVRIDDELIEYTGITGTSFDGVIRGSLGTVANSHDDGATIDSFYLIEDNAIEMALKLMLSRKDGEHSYEEEIDVTRFVQVDPANNIPDGILVENFRFQDELGISIGDLVTITGAANVENNITELPITGIQITQLGTTLIIGGAGLVVEDKDVDMSTPIMSLRSKYDTFPVGCNMKPSQVDVAQHENLATTFPGNNQELSIYIKDTINARDFIAEECYFPQGMYEIPRKGRASVGITNPPLADIELQEYSEGNIKNANSLKIERGVTKFFHNAIIYKFDEDTIDDKFLAGEVILSEKSQERIPSGVKSLTIQSKGLRDTNDVREFIAAQARRFTDRFQYASETLKIETLYSDGFQTEVGDVVLAGSPGLKISDSSNATRNFTPRLWEVINKSWNLKTGKVVMNLLDTGFGLDARYGSISPNSFLASGSSTLQMKLKPSFNTPEFGDERSKWSNFIGEEIVIRNEDWTFVESTTLISFDDDDQTIINVSPPISISPPEDYLVDLPYYPTSTDPTENEKQKGIHVTMNPQVIVTGAVDDFTFEVGVGDINKFITGLPVRVHNTDFSVTSVDNTVDDDAVVTLVDTVLNRVTVDKSLTFTPLVGYEVDLIGYADGGSPYRYV